MRLIGGEFGGRVLRAPKGMSTRPTSERVREALFSILGPPPDGAWVLDLFAGSGALAFEALSRGAAHAVLCDTNAQAIAAISQNARALGVESQVRVARLDAVAWLKKASGDLAFHWIFIDPPYDTPLREQTLSVLGNGHAALGSNTTVVVEHRKQSALADTHGSLRRIDLRPYGDTVLSFYRGG